MPVVNADTRLKTKLLSILRQKADQLPALFFDTYGFTSLDHLVTYLRTLKGLGSVTREDVIHVIMHDQQGQFEWDEPLVRATFGFSASRVYRGKEMAPPEKLYHGTHRRLVDQIMARGLVPIASDVIQLAMDPSLIGEAGGTLQMLTVDAREAYRAGLRFYRAGELWYFSDSIPPDYLTQS